MPATRSMIRTLEAPTAEPQRQRSVNDLAIRVGTVNGSGSQSANLVLLRALNGMGIPCSGKNVFPSNIEGLPTWFHIRASGRGYVGHRLDTPVLVCMNEQTAADDIRQLLPGSICFYRDDIKEDLPALRDDVLFFGVPFTDLATRSFRAVPGLWTIEFRLRWSREHRSRRWGLWPRPVGSRWTRSDRPSAASSPGARPRPPRSTSAPPRWGPNGPPRTSPRTSPSASRGSTRPRGRSSSRGTTGPRRCGGRCLPAGASVLTGVVRSHPPAASPNTPRGFPRGTAGFRRPARFAVILRPRTSWRPSAWRSVPAGARAEAITAPSKAGCILADERIRRPGVLPRRDPRSSSSTSRAARSRLRLPTRNEPRRHRPAPPAGPRRLLASS